MKTIVSALLLLVTLIIPAVADGSGSDETPREVPQKIDVTGLRAMLDVSDGISVSKLGDCQVAIQNDTGIELELLFSGKDETILSKKGMQIFFFETSKGNRVQLLIGAPGKHGLTYNINLQPDGFHSLIVKKTPKGIELFENKEASKPARTAKR